jgi:hypothetical protein
VPPGAAGHDDQRMDRTPLHSIALVVSVLFGATVAILAVL